MILRLHSPSHAGGKVALDTDEYALTNEIGRESIVRDGVWYMLPPGPHMEHLRKGDIVFSAKQTEELLKAGRTSTYAKALSAGTINALANGSIHAYSGYTGSGYNPWASAGGGYKGNSASTIGSGASSSGGGGSNTSSKDDEHKIDWIEIAIKRFEALLKKLASIAENTFNNLITRLDATTENIVSTSKDIDLQGKAYDRYIKEANSIGLSAGIAEKIRNGEIDINSYDESTRKKIDEYKKWYEKADDCATAIEELKTQLGELYKNKFDYIQKDYENRLELMQEQAKSLDSELKRLETQGYKADASIYEEQAKDRAKRVEIMKSQLADMQKAFDDLNASGFLQEGSEAWYEMMLEIQKVKNEIDDTDMMNGYYNTIDLIMFLRHSLMPNIKVDETDAKTEANKLTQKALVGTAVLDIEKLSLTTASNAVLAMAKIVANSSKYQIRIKEASLVGKVWTGSFALKSYSDDDDTADSQTVSVVISDSYEKYVRQKIDTVLAKASDDIIDLVALFKTEEGDFSSEIKKYSLSMLNSFHESCQAALNILIEQGVSDEGTMAFNNNVYKKLYAPMRMKCSLIEDEMKQRELEISVVEKVQSILENQRSYIQSQLNMENYLGRILWTELMSYRREDIYQNDNYISDGLDNAELIERALEFIDVAKKEIFKSATSQYSITAEMKNLLVMKEFQPIVNSFETGNWIRVSVDNTVYKLRLIEYQIDFSNIPVVSVVFSDVNTTTDGISDIKSILRQASSMASSYESVARQASQGAKGSQNIDKIIQDGISASDTEIVDDKKRQSQTWGKNGMLFREYDQVQERYYDEQMRIINSTIAITDNNWKTTKTAIGKFFYLDPVTKELRQVWGVNGELIAGRLLLGESLGIYNMAGTLSFDNEGLVVKNENNTVSINPNSKQIFDIANKQGSLITFNDSGDLVIIGDITAKSLTLSDGVSIDSDKIDGLALVSLSGDYSDLNNLPDLSGIEKNAEDIRTNADEIKSNTDSIAELQSKANSTDEIINSLMSKVEELQKELESLKGGSTGESTGGTV